MSVSSHLCGNIGSELNTELNLYWLKPVLQMLKPCHLVSLTLCILEMGCCDQRVDPGSVLCDQPRLSWQDKAVFLFFYSPNPFGQMSPGLDLENLWMSFEHRKETANC